MKSIYYLVMEHKERIRSIVKDNNCFKPMLFGSVARKEDTPESDIDIMITLKPGTSLFALGSIEVELEDLLNRRINIVDSRTVHDKLRPHIEKDLVAI